MAGQSTKRITASDETAAGFTAEERAAMQERAKETKAASRRGPRANKADDAAAVLAKIAEMEGSDRELGERLHAIITASAPTLTPKLWYGMPVYAQDGKVLCFFQAAQKFNTRYATPGFNDVAHLDDGTIWPTAFALKGLTDDDEAWLTALVKKAVS